MTERKGIAAEYSSLELLPASVFTSVAAYTDTYQQSTDSSLKCYATQAALILIKTYSYHLEKKA